MGSCFIGGRVVDDILYSNGLLYFQYLAIPVEKEVKVYNSETWDVAFTLTDDSIKQVPTIFRRLCFRSFLT